MFGPIKDKWLADGLALLAHGVLVSLGLFASPFPIPGQPAALHPIGGEVGPTLANLLGDPGTRLLSSANGTPVVLTQRDPFTLLIEHGVLVVSANPLTCNSEWETQR